METMYDRATERIRVLNDECRLTLGQGFNCKLVVTDGVSRLEPNTFAGALATLRSFRDFDEDNPEHDFGAFTLDGHRFLWKIDYYDTDMEGGSENPASRTGTMRVLTLMLAEDY